MCERIKFLFVFVVSFLFFLVSDLRCRPTEIEILTNYQTITFKSRFRTSILYEEPIVNQQLKKIKI